MLNEIDKLFIETNLKENINEILKGFHWDETDSFRKDTTGLRIDITNRKNDQQLFVNFDFNMEHNLSNVLVYWEYNLEVVRKSELLHKITIKKSKTKLVDFKDTVEAVSEIIEMLFWTIICSE